jgi:hypothetical protein
MTFVRTATLVFLVLTGSLSGCAVFRGNDLPEVGTLPGPAAAAPKPAAGYAFGSAVDMGSKKPTQENLRAIQENEFAGVLRESGYFATVEKGNGKDINISVELVESGNPSAMVAAVITGLSLYTIPSWATMHLEATCRVTTTGGKTHEYKLSDSATLVQWLPMIVVFPFKPFSEIQDLRINLYKSLIVKMQADGLLPKPGQPGKVSSILIRFESPAV